MFIQKRPRFRDYVDQVTGLVVASVAAKDWSLSRLMEAEEIANKANKQKMEDLFITID